jgi:thiamine-monophosphate kinase
MFPVPLPEKVLIARIRKSAQANGRTIALGIGDDCSILRPPSGHEILVTTDFTLENVHFRRDWHAPEIVGHRCLTRGLSDMAAMGAEPLAAFLSLALPPKLPQAWVDRFMTGLLKLAREFKIPLAGGDTAQSPSRVLADIVVIGSAPTGRAIRRSGAKAGDRIYVTGALGGSSAALQQLRTGKKVRPQDFPAHFHPIPRLAIGRFLRQKSLATAMIDLSDGLSTDLAHLCEESRVGADLLADAIPLARVGRRKSEVDVQQALHGGEDYELLFTVPRARKVPSHIAGVPVTPIGWIRKGKRICLTSEQGLGTELRPQGWEHFRDE